MIVDIVAREIIRLFIILMFMTGFITHNPCYAQEDEETYNISLVKTADLENDDEIHEVDGKKVLAETYTVKDGDHLWQLFRERNLLEKKNLIELIRILKKLNTSLDNIDLIYPGETIIIPLVISPAGGETVLAEAVPETVSLQGINDIDMTEYVVKQGDSVIKIVGELYDIPEKELYSEYLVRLKQTNPYIQDLNLIYPGQKIRIPIYSPKVVRLPIKEDVQTVSEPMTEAQKDDIQKISVQIGEIFTLIGEQWLPTGEHFFPLKTGGQLKLNAESYPIVELKGGKKVIVDLYNDLPEKMGDLITSNWKDYGIVHLEGNDDLKRAFDKIINICGYKKIYGPGEALVTGSEIPVRITADRIIEQDKGSSLGSKGIIVINFCDDRISRTPEVIIDYLASSGIKVIEYPLPSEKAEIDYYDMDIIDVEDDAYSLVQALLDLTVQDYSRNVELPVYQNEKGDINLVIKADFSVNVRGREYIIDLSGLGNDIINLLRDHQFMVYSISNNKSPSEILTGVLGFLGREYEAKPHKFLSTNGPESKNIAINIQGISFRDRGSKNMFATAFSLPRELTYFLNMNGYRALQLPVAVKTFKEESK